MKARIDTGSDVAMIGAWDAQRGSTPPGPAERKLSLEALEADAADGHLFLVHTGGDGGGPLDVYVDEAIPAAVVERYVSAGREFLLTVPSGRLIVGGAEYYRSPTHQADGGGSLALPAGQYAVRCYVPRDEESVPESEEALKTLVGSGELAAYDRYNRIGCIGGLSTLLLFPLWASLVGWKLGLAIAAVVFVGFFHVREWVLKRNLRYRRLNEIVPAFRTANQDPWLVLQLRSVGDRAAAGLTGGSLSL